jgi:hypothetical protein
VKNRGKFIPDSDWPGSWFYRTPEGRTESLHSHLYRRADTSGFYLPEVWVGKVAPDLGFWLGEGDQYRSTLGCIVFREEMKVGEYE